MMRRGGEGIYGAYHYFQQYFNYIVTVSFVGKGNGVPRENH